jgi:hypothetical protein
MPIPSHFSGAGNSMLSTAAAFGGAQAAVGAGTDASTATQLTGTMITLTGASNSGVKLQQTEVGAFWVFRNDGGNTVKVYPFSTATTINAAQASLDIATAKTVFIWAVTATTLASITAAS